MASLEQRPHQGNTLQCLAKAHVVSKDAAKHNQENVRDASRNKVMYGGM
jgi:hypothetical protein